MSLRGPLLCIAALTSIFAATGASALDSAANKAIVWPNFGYREYIQRLDPSPLAPLRSRINEEYVRADGGVFGTVNIGSGVSLNLSKYFDDVFAAEKRAFGRFSGPRAFAALESAYFELANLSPETLAPLFDGSYDLSRNGISLGDELKRLGFNAGSFSSHAKDLHSHVAAKLLTEEGTKSYPLLIAHLSATERSRSNYLLAAQLRETAIRYMESASPVGWVEVAENALLAFELSSSDRAIKEAERVANTQSVNIDNLLKSYGEKRKALVEIMLFDRGSNLRAAVRYSDRLRALGLKKEAIENLISYAEMATDSGNAYITASEFARADGETAQADLLRIQAIGKGGLPPRFYRDIYPEWAFKLGRAHVQQATEPMLRWEYLVGLWPVFKEKLSAIYPKEITFRDINIDLATSCREMQPASPAWGKAVSFYKSNPADGYAASAIILSTIYADDYEKAIPLIKTATKVPIRSAPGISAKVVTEVFTFLAVVTGDANVLRDAPTLGETSEEQDLLGNATAVQSILTSDEGVGNLSIGAYEKSLRDSFYSSVTVRNNLAVLYLSRGNSASARKLLESAFSSEQNAYIELTKSAVVALEKATNWQDAFLKLVNDKKAPLVVRISAARWLPNHKKLISRLPPESATLPRGIALERKCKLNYQLRSDEPLSFRPLSEVWLLPQPPLTRIK